MIAMRENQDGRAIFVFFFFLWRAVACFGSEDKRKKRQVQGYGYDTVIYRFTNVYLGKVEESRLVLL